MTTDFVRITDEFEKYEFDAANFSHEHHVGVAYEMLQRHDFLTAMYRYSDVINTVATRLGAGDKFNITITLAFMSLIAERAHGQAYADAQAFIDANPDLITGNPLFEFYSKERLGCDKARRLFLLPDLQPLPATHAAT